MTVSSLFKSHTVKEILFGVQNNIIRLEYGTSRQMNTNLASACTLYSHFQFFSMVDLIFLISWRPRLVY